SHDKIDDAKRLKTALAVQAKTGKINFWYDQGILPGAEWKKEIENKLGEADIIVLLLSPEFWASDFIWEQELPLVAARYAAGAQVLCVMLTDNDFQETEWSGLQAVPQLKGRLTPISRWPDKDEAWQEVAGALKRMLG
ncbi:MAG TPA: TIR domain-containing protein, partial [Saprospiraceae bacterium]|nr:TIR domain-containing protein [Saprospiraceae bacterium]